MNHMWPYPIRLAGISFYTKPEDIISDDLMCERESNSPYDENAIVVFMIVGEFRAKIGYISRHIARQLKDEKFPHPGVVVFRGEKGVMIQI